MQLRGFVLAVVVLIGFVVDAQVVDSAKVKKEDITIDFLFNYYQQDGNNSPVTGGIGTEEIKNIAPKISVVIPVKQKHYISFSGGVDAYSSASSDNVSNPLRAADQKSGASANDQRFYGDLGYTLKNKVKKTEYGGGLNMSLEYDVISSGANFQFSKTTKDGNKTTALSASYLYDIWKLIYPIELRNGQVELLDNNIRQSMNVSLSQSWVANKRIALSANIEGTFQTGLLSTPFHRVYFTDIDTTDLAVNREGLLTGSNLEILPDTRLKIPIGLKGNYHATDFMIFKAYYRFYYDTWGIVANTAKLSIPIKINHAFRIYPFYRFHIQTAADYYAPFVTHTGSEEFYTSDTDLSAFQSHKVGMGISYSPLYGLFRFKGGKDRVNMLKSIDLRYAYYQRNNGLKAHMITLGVGYLIQR